LQLMEQRMVTLDDPAVIETIIPEAAQAKIISGEKGEFQFHAPKNSITLRMLLDHSCGFSYSVSSVSTNLDSHLSFGLVLQSLYQGLTRGARFG
jgi:CubicO group peptidase (beta-lactamase class C family)